MVAVHNGVFSGPCGIHVISLQQLGEYGRQSSPSSAQAIDEDLSVVLHNYFSLQYLRASLASFTPLGFESADIMQESARVSIKNEVNPISKLNCSVSSEFSSPKRTVKSYFITFLVTSFQLCRR